MVPEAGVDGPTYRLARAGEGRDVSLWGLVPEAGLEPARFLRRGILNPLCLPISPLRRRGTTAGEGGPVASARL